jgi:hypothetical protein
MRTWPPRQFGAIVIALVALYCFLFWLIIWMRGGLAAVKARWALIEIDASMGLGP